MQILRHALPLPLAVPFALPLALALALALGACGDKSGTDDSGGSPGDGGGGGDTGTALTDADHDGVAVEEGDCNDADPQVYPGAEERCDGQDDNCDGAVDEGYADTDTDGVADCVDTETCDGLDNNGDGQVDEGYPDSDGDGVADCVATEICDGLDNNGDGQVDEGFDLDGDGVTSCAPVPDCDDSDPARSPALAEVAGDRIDNDCDGLVDEGSWAAGDLVITEIMSNPQSVSDPDGEWFEVFNTTDHDLYLNGLRIESDPGEVHDIADATLLTVPAGTWFVFGSNGDALTNGGVDVGYVYDTIRLSNEDDTLALYAGDVLLDAVAWDNGATMPDPAGASMSLDDLFLGAAANDDADGWCASYEPWAAGTDDGSPGGPNPYCTTTDHDGDGYGIAEGDCDDTDASVGPDAVETWYDGFDQNCDGRSDYDADLDGYDSVDWGGTDCDDSRDDINPGEREICDAADTDENCNGLADDADPGVTDPATLYPDADHDGWGATGTPVLTCESPEGYGTGSGDCNDGDATVYPGAPDTWYDGVDQNCDGADDFDADADGYDASSSGGADCDDTRADINPAQREVCDPADVDENCNGLADDADPTVSDAGTWYPDADGDGYGSDADRVVTCEAPDGWSDAGGDCDDSDRSINPGATEVWYDGIDEDCNGWSDYDADQDGFESEDWAGDDCDDTDRSVHPYAWEDATDGIDNDCDGGVDRADTDTVHTLRLSDDSASLVTFASTTFPFCGTDRRAVYVSSNGRIVFGVGDTTYSESASVFASGGLATIAGWWDDLNPSSGGEVEWIDYGDAMGIYFIGVPEYSVGGANTFSYILRADGQILLDYGDMSALDGLVGWTCGTGLAPSAVDLTAQASVIPDGSAGIGMGTEDAVYELFLGTAASSGDVGNLTFAFCSQQGSDADGDGWTDACGDTDDSDPLIHP